MFSRDPILCDVEHVTTEPDDQYLTELAQSLNVEGIRASSIPLVTESGTATYLVTVATTDPVALFEQLAWRDDTWFLAVTCNDQRGRTVTLQVSNE